MEQEMIDWLDENGHKIGVIDKAIAHKEGYWHKSVHVWIINDKNEFLLQHRCLLKDFFPNCWDCAFAGHVGAGESSIASALREGKEEIDLKLYKNELEYLLTYKDKLTWRDKKSNEFVDVYLVRKNLDINNLSLQKEEVDKLMWLDIDKFFAMIEKGDEIFILHGKEEYSRLKEILKKQEVFA